MKIMATLAVALGILSSATVISAQQGFNRLYSYPNAPAFSLNGGVLPTDSAYYVCGTSNYTNIAQTQGVNFMKLDSMGSELISVRLDFDTSVSFPPWGGEGIFSNNNQIIILSNLIDLGNINGVLYALDTFPVIIRFNSLGQYLDTFEIKLTSSPLIPYNYFAHGMLFKENGCLLACEKWAYIPAAQTSYIDITLIRLDSNNQVLWTRNYGVPGNYDERFPTIIETPDGYLLKYVRLYPSFENSTHILKMDTLGNIQWQYQSSINESIFSWDFTATNDSGYAYCGNHLVLDNDGDLSPVSYVCKLDNNRQLVWERQYGRPGYWNDMKSISELWDGSLICAGNMGIKHPGLPDSGDVSGYLVKLSPIGDSLWMRHYTIIPTNSDIQTTWDMKPCPDGGFIFCGEAYDLIDFQNYPQRAWVVKTDSFGCVVPGCQLYDAIHEPPSPAEQIPILVYPNPASSVLNVYLPPFAAQVEGLSYTLTDMQGHRVKEWAADGPGGTTYMVPVGDLAAGVYVLTLWREGKVVGASQLIIE